MSNWKFNKVSQYRGGKKARHSAIVDQIGRQKETGNKYMMNEDEKGLFVVHAVVRYNEITFKWEPVPAV